MFRAEPIAHSDRAQIALEAAAVFTRLFAAAVLLLFPHDGIGRRRRWIAAGLIVLGCGGIAFGYIPPSLGAGLPPETLMYEATAVWTIAAAVFAIGLVPRTPKTLNARACIAVAAATLLITGAIAAFASHLPILVHGSVTDLAARSGPVLPGMTAWHWIISAIPVAIGVVTIAGLLRRARTDTSAAPWLLPGMILFVAAEFHGMLWPSNFLPVVTATDIVRFAFGVLLTIGAVYELRRTARERMELLEAQREEARRLTDLNLLKASFTAMVAHELGTPLAAIRFGAQALATKRLSEEEENEILSAIKSEAETLTALVSDVQTAARVERDDFNVKPRPVRLADLLVNAATYARALPGKHPVSAPLVAGEVVSADPERIVQVLRNLLSNAAKYSDEGSPITIRTCRIAGKLRIDVEDRGYGIEPADLVRVFEKFGRGRDRSGRRVPGVGLGLYLSRRIVQAHGSDLIVTSEPGSGSVFGFELEVVL